MSRSAILRRHKTLALALALLTLLIASGFQDTPKAEPKPDAKPDPKALAGAWKVDLRPTPGAPDYYQKFVVKSFDGKSFEGTFYGTDLQDARTNNDWGSVRFAFTTRDQSGTYHHSGTLKGDRIEGLSHSLGRGALWVWIAEREK